MTLTGFLLARIAEDEARAREDGSDAMVGWRWKHYPQEAYEKVQALTLETSKRILADCEAKRRIVGLHGDDDPGDCTPWGRAPGEPCDTLRLLALPYADHPDYREEWKP